MRRELYLRILDEIGLGHLEAPVVERSLRSLGPGALLLRALAWCRRRAWGRARADVAAALEIEPVHELTKIIAGMVFHLCRDYDRGLCLLETVASERKRVAHRALGFADERATRLGWTHDTRRIRAAIAELGVADLRAHVENLRRRASAGQGGPTGDALRRARWWLERVHEQGVDAAREALSGIEDEGGVAAVRAELELIAGRLDVALRELAGAGAIELQAALLLACGQLSELLELDAGAEDPGPRWFALRCEAALLAAGRSEDGQARERLTSEAGVALEQARERAPQAPTLELLACLLADARGRFDVHDFDGLVRRLPALCSDAARELGLELWNDDGVTRDLDAARAILNHARTMISAERSLERPAYWTRSSSGELRLRPIADAALARSLHARDDTDLDLAGPMLRRVLRLPTVRPAGVHARPESVLSAAEREQFLRDGYVHLRGAFPRALAAELVDDAIARIQSDPQRWVQYYAGEPGRSLAGFDPEDPSTWTWPRIDVLGNRRFAIPEFSPRAWAAIVELLGDPRRIRTRTWTNNFIANCCLDADSPYAGPEPDWESWHLDDPSVHTRLDAIQCGLLVAAIYSDIDTRSGGTWLALDSPGRVAQALAAQPEGVDFTNIDAGPAISSQCERFHEITGEAGDIVIIHPLMIHSAAPNPSGRIRWLANPMIYLEEPLDHRREDPNLVELLIRDALAEP